MVTWLPRINAAFPHLALCPVLLGLAISLRFGQWDVKSVLRSYQEVSLGGGCVPLSFLFNLLAGGNVVGVTIAL